MICFRTACLLLAIRAVAGAQAEPPEMEALLGRFAEVYAVVEQQAADPVDSSVAFYSGAIPGMLKRLDPHSVFFDPVQFEQLRQMQTSTERGFGSVVSVLPGRVIVLQTLPETPAARAGIEPGDEILAVNGIALARLGLDQLIALLSESRRGEVHLDVRRPGASRLLEFVMTPANVQSPSVDLSFLVRDGIGYIRVNAFEGETSQQIRQAIEELGGNKLEALLLDLRGNPGGLVPSALETAALFLEPGQVVAAIRGRAVETDEMLVPDDASPYHFPLAVLMNERSASASEIVAAALQDHGRAVIVGVPSYGKGLVQSVYSLSEGTGLALTTAFYYTPGGRSIQHPLNQGQLHTGPSSGEGGVQPDYLVLAEAMPQLRMVLDASGWFPSFATQVLRKHEPIRPDFEVSPALLDEFQVYLSERSIQPSIADWSASREWIRSRLKQEIFNQALGVAIGDEIEIRRDPQVLRALEAVSSNPGKTKTTTAPPAR